MSFTAAELQNFLHKEEYGQDFYDGEHFFANGGELGSFGHFTPVEAKSASYWDTEYEGASTSDCWYVLKHDESNRLFIRVGTYSSYDGYNWDHIQEVTQGIEQVTFNVYLAVGTNKKVQRGQAL